MNLRPHHALCIQKFTGHGYDERFTRHMAQICQTLRAGPETEVRIISSCDDLCAKCPNRQNGTCSTLQKVENMDRAVAAALDLSEGETIPWSELALRARERVFETEEFENICQSCQWYGLCLSTPII